MIVVDLQCQSGHRFEGWFASHAEFERQKDQQLITCPSCGIHAVERLPSAPHVAQRTQPQTQAPQTPQAPQPTQVLERIISALREQASKAEDVGQGFATEARKIHYGDAAERSIRGTASPAETKSLIEEGITVLPVPPAKEDLH